MAPMARTVAKLPSGARLTDFVSLGVLADRFPLDKVHEILQQTERKSQRQRHLPAHVVVYYVIALALYMEVSYGEVLRCLLEGLAWLGLPVQRIRCTGRSGISQARSRLGAEPLRRLYQDLVGPIAQPQTRGSRYRQWTLVSLDGSTLDLADTTENESAFGRPVAARGQSGFPQARFVSLVENGTHVLFGAQIGSYTTAELELAGKVVERLQPGWLCLADRLFFGYELWQRASKSGADLLWRVKTSRILVPLKRLSDGSYLSKIYPSSKDRERDQAGHIVRVIDYHLTGIENVEPSYRLVTSILDEHQAPAEDLAALYHERWEIEGALDELKTHLRGRKITLRSKTPELVRQEFYGLLLAHSAVRGLMHEAALRADLDPDELSFVHSVRVIKRKLMTVVAFPPSAHEEAS
ncbi:MAG TPA: IS4 family transposase [Thermoanaerobaculia bacterium]|nr:IS4 family transposase [Thermoanaerobaculia bacterium]